MSPRFAWPTLENIRFDVLSVATDAEASDAVVHDQHRTVNLADIGGWRTAQLEVEATLPEDAEEVIGPALATAQGHALTTCVGTKTRIPHALPWGRNRASLRGTVVIERDLIAGNASLHCVVTGVVLGVAHRVLGRSGEWKIHADTSPRPDTGAGPFPMIWDHFSEPVNGGPAFLKTVADAPFWFDVAPDPPILWLNRDIDCFDRLIGWDNARTWKRDIRDLTGTSIAASVLSTLVQEAAGAVVRDDTGGIQEPLRDIEKAALRQVGEQLVTVGGYEDLLERIANAKGNDEDRRILTAQLDVAIEQIVFRGRIVAEASRRAVDG